MTTAQLAKLAQAHREARAAGTTLTDYLTSDGYVVVTDTDGDVQACGAIWPDGSLHM